MKPGLWRNRHCTDIDFQLTDVYKQKSGGYQAKAIYVRRDWGSGPRILSWANRDGVITLDPDLISISAHLASDWVRLDS